MKIKLISNPYTREIKFLTYKEQIQQWETLKEGNVNSRLREDESGKIFLPFRIKGIIDTIMSEYYVPGENINIEFEGTQDEYSEIENVCNDEDLRSKLTLIRNSRFLENARVIFEPAKEIFSKVHPIIEKIVKDDIKVCKDLNKVSDALKDIIPICVFGNYSAGKSTFINALIGSEVLPSGGDPVTAKVYKIERSRQSDNAKISFGYRNEPYEILFEGNDVRLLKGNIENELIKNILTAIAENDTSDMNVCISTALELINGYEKKDKEETIISNEIDIEIPFMKSGILGQSYNNFVIFDTPGSNSESNAEHYKVLQEALEGFSNGIPVWVSTYETIDSTDNANLCEKILDIKALDKRFTMIVLNKADGSDLDEGGFTAKKEQEILEYNSIEKMYSSGIYFVSSIMGLGSKNDDILIDKHYRKIYRSQKDMYSDPEDEDYVSLYKYNIMPHQIKKNVEIYSADCSNIIYANSGLYCVEMEMENFASKHSAYNKCQMVYIFLNEVINETDKRIIQRTESLKRTREARQKELDKAKADLIENLNKTAEKAESDSEKNSRTFVKNFVSANLNFHYEVSDLDKINDNLHTEKTNKSVYSVQEKEYEDSKSKILEDVKKNGKELFSRDGRFIDKIGKLKDDFLGDYNLMKDAKGEKSRVGKEIDKDTSNDLLQIVIDEYRNKVLIAQENLNNTIREHWQNNATSLRNNLLGIVTGSEALTSTQREELSRIIMDYQPLSFNDDSDDVFIKTRFLRGNLLGLQLINDERLNTRKLASSFNSRISNVINEIAADTNKSCYVSYKNWKSSLSMVIEENITEYNPQLRDMSDMIKEETEKIAELEDNQVTIKNSLKAIEDLMAWKERE